MRTAEGLDRTDSSFCCVTMDVAMARVCFGCSGATAVFSTAQPVLFLGGVPPRLLLVVSICITTSLLRRLALSLPRSRNIVTGSVGGVPLM